MMNRSQACRILGISPTQTSMEEVKDAYRKLARQWHPDRFSDATEKAKAEERFKQINGAYDYLKSHPISLKTSTTQSTSQKSSSPSPKTDAKQRKTTPGELYEEAAALGKLGRYEAAIELLGLAIKLSPKYAQAYRYRGFIRSVLGFEMSAEEDLRRAKAIDNEQSQNQKTPSKSGSATEEQAQKTAKTDFSQSKTSNSEPQSVQLFTMPTPPNLESWSLITTIAAPQAQCITYSRDNNTIITGDRLGGISLWSLKTQQQYIRLNHHKKSITRLKLSANGQILMSASRDGTVSLWLLSNATLMRSLKHDSGAVFGLWMTGDRQYVVTGGEDKILRVWQTKDGQLIQSFTQQDSYIWAIEGNREGNTFVTLFTKSELQSWQLLGQQRPVESGKARANLQYPGSAIAFLDNPGRLICGHVTGVVRIWDEEKWHKGDNHQYEIAAHAGMVRAIAPHPSESQFATAGEDGWIRLWTGEGKLVSAMAGHQGPVLDLGWSRQGHQLASLGVDGKVKVWQNPA